jgi:hypothetical protein
MTLFEHLLEISESVYDPKPCRENEEIILHREFKTFVVCRRAQYNHNFHCTY